MPRGGARGGAGRKPGKTHKKVLISLPLAVAEWLEKKENKSGFIASLVEEKMSLYDKARDRITFPEYPQDLVNLVQDGYDYNEGDDHWKWLTNAPKEDILDWFAYT